MEPAALALALGMEAGWSVFIVLTRAALLVFGFDPWSLAMAVQIAAGAALLTAAGLRSLPTGPIRRHATWAIGGLRVVTTACFSAALLHGAATTVTLLATGNILIAALGVFLFFGRRPRASEAPGFLLIALGVVLLALRLEGGLANPAVPLIIASETCVVLASLLAERHPDNLGTTRQRLALTGFVTLLSSGTLLILWSLAAVALPAMRFGPSATAVFATLASPWLWLAALVLGGLLRAPLTYMAFYFTRLLGADGYMLVSIALPVTTLIAEIALSLTGLVPAPSRDPLDLACGALIILGGTWVIVKRIRRAP
jgi:drug/metabolite transporter (DMT)-like permease